MSPSGGRPISWEKISNYIHTYLLCHEWRGPFTPVNTSCHTCECTYIPIYCVTSDVAHSHLWIRHVIRVNGPGPHTYIYICMYTRIWICRQNHMCGPSASTGWRRPIGCLKLQVIFSRWATNCRALLRKMTYKDMASYGSSPPCTHIHSR